VIQLLLSDCICQPRERPTIISPNYGSADSNDLYEY